MRSLLRLALLGCLLGIPAAVPLLSHSTALTLSGSGMAADLSSVSALSSRTAWTAWTAGSYYMSLSDLGDFKTVTGRWNGRSWSRVSSPSPPGYIASLYGVAAVAPDDVWAVGRYNAKSGNDFTVIEHWSGKGWKVVPSPNPGRWGNGLAAVSAVSSTDVWAVGYENNPPQTLIVHWNGKSWSAVASSSPGGPAGSILTAVSARSSNDVWAVGSYSSGSGPKALIEHWNGASWAVLPGVDPSSSDNELMGVSAVSASDVWAVGYTTTASGDQALIEHWDGTRWARVSCPHPTRQSALAAVSALSPADVWAVGSYGTGPVKTLTEHWDGRRWTKTASPNLSRSQNQLLGVSAASARDVWAVGFYDAGAGHRTLVERWDGTSWAVR